MKVVILDIPTTEIFSTPEFNRLSSEVKKYRLHDQKVKLEDKYNIRFSPPHTYNRGLLFVAAVLEEKGVEVDYFNGDYDKDFWQK